ncbi:YcjF family protein [bacterium]|nr:YcjF family protein [bacterium]
MAKLLKTLERIAVVVGIGLSFFAVIETLRAYQILYDTHPWLGYGFLAVVAALLLYVVWQVRSLFTLGAALVPPELPGEGPVSPKQAKRFEQHMQRVCDRFSSNPHLVTKARQLDRLREAVDALPEPAGDGSNVRDAVLAVERDHVSPLLIGLDEAAEAVVSDNVGIVSVGTALSPYRSVDMYIVLARNTRMINRILAIYRTRPTTRETVRVFYDIFRVVAAINLLNAMDNVWAGLGRHVPFLGRYGEAMSEGMFSGLLTSVAGHAAIDRCRSYRPWSQEEAVRKYRGKLHRWSLDVFGILKRHSFDKLKRKSKDPSPEDVDLAVDEALFEQELEQGDGGKAWWNPFGRKRAADETTEPAESGGSAST